MTERIEEVKHTRTIYVASDGKEFLYQAQCKAYEAELEREVLKGVANGLPHFHTNPPLFCDDMEERTVAYFYARNITEAYAALTTELYNEKRKDIEECLDADAYPCWVACISDGDGCGYVLGTAEDISERLEGFNRRISMLMEQNASKSVSKI